LTKEEIAEALWDRNLKRVSEVTGLHHNTLLALRAGTVDKPNIGTIEILRRYLRGDA
jgi:hypothetical protein